MATDPAPSAFSASGEEAITRSIDLESHLSAQRSLSSDFSDFYEIEGTAGAIIQGNFKRVALQFPDELLHDSVPIYRLLKHRVGDGHDLYVLADTSYGSCCVDEIAAQHVDADLVVHYGHACMSKTSRLPVIYVFGRKAIDVESCIDRLAAVVTTSGHKSVVLRHDVAYSYQAGEIARRIREKVSQTGIAILYHEVPTRVDPSPTQVKLGPDVAEGDISVTTRNGYGGKVHASDASTVEECDTAIIYIGEESLTLTNLLMTHSSSEVYSYNPSTNLVQLESAKTNKLLMRRFATVQKARDADVFGILVGTLGVASYLPLISRLREMLSKARKKSYTISVGKLNPAKLANFMEIECFVLAACPENSVIEAKEFLRPIITPFELEIALQAEVTWTGRYVLDFERLMNEQRNATHMADEDRDPDQPSFSLITGKYRHARRFGGSSHPRGDEDGAVPSAVVLRNQDGTVTTLSDSAGAMFLHSRSYQGLDARVGEDAPGILEQGRSGIARGYTDDHS